MSQSNKKGFAALYDLQERKKQAKIDSPPLPTTPHHSPEIANTIDSPPVTTTPHQSPPLPREDIERQETKQQTLNSAPQITPAPAKDFNRRANSLERDALPQGLFPGSSKKIYDALYLRSRGAHPPRSRVRAARRDFLDWTDIRNLKTVDGHIRYLTSVGLIVRHWELGSTEGSEYEVRLPEELPRVTTTPHQSPGDTASHLSGSGYSHFLGSGGYSQTVDSTTIYDDNKTLLKTKEINTDDEAAPLARALAKAERELSGKVTSDPSKWEDLADILIKELKIAAGRTTVSSVPAFLAEHLRRRLWKKEKRQIEAEAAEQKATASGIKIDVSQCEECYGTGMYYPSGYDKGVAKCPHSKLTGES